MKTNKQGVRDLNDIKGKSVGRKYVEPTATFICKKHTVKTNGFESVCIVCGTEFHYNGR